VAEGRIRRVLWGAFVLNAAMVAVEVAASLLAGSTALQADALDFLGDAANYGVSLSVVGRSGRARAGAALIKGWTMAAFGTWVLAGAAWHAWTGTVPRAGVMGAVAVLALAVNGSVAVMLYATRGHDANMGSVWLCARNDAIANVAVLLAASGVFASASRWPDIAVAVLIATLNLRSAAHVVARARGDLRAETCTATP
jgi:Co/Zn/Cd efflux system component